MTTWKTIAIIGCALVGAAAAGTPAEAGGFSAANVRGAYGYSLTGTVGDPATSYVETGRLVADGRGNLTAEGTAVVGGVSVLPISYVCTYTVTREGILSADCMSGRARSQFVGPIFDWGLEARYIALPQPGQPASLTGFARKQTGRPF